MSYPALWQRTIFIEPLALWPEGVQSSHDHVPQIARLRYNNDVVMITNTNLTLKQTLTEPLTERHQTDKNTLMRLYVLNPICHS